MKKRIRKKIGNINPIKPNDKMVSLVKFVNDFDDPQKAVPVFFVNAIGSVDENNFTDKLITPPATYKKYDNLEKARKALEIGELKIEEPYCYSSYDYNLVFGKLSKIKTKEEAIEYLKKYNENEQVYICWSFLDKDEIEKLNKKQIKKIYYE